MKESTTHGPARRRDRFYLSAALMPAVQDIDVIDMDGLSDHDTLRLRLDRDAVTDLLSRWPVEQTAAAEAMAHALR